MVAGYRRLGFKKDGGARAREGKGSGAEWGSRGARAGLAPPSSSWSEASSGGGGRELHSGGTVNPPAHTH